MAAVSWLGAASAVHHPVVLSAAAVGTDQQPGRVRVDGPTPVLPPAADARDREGGGVVVGGVIVERMMRGAEIEGHHFVLHRGVRTRIVRGVVLS